MYALVAALGDGPLVLTDLERAHGGTSVISVYAVARGSACATLNGRQYAVPPQARPLLLPANASNVHGAHLNVRANESACAFAYAGNDLLSTSEAANQGTLAALAWPGYRLYE